MQARTGASISDARHADAAMRAQLERVVARACPSWAVAHRDDIVQVAMLRMLRAKRAREEDELPAKYLWKVAYSATIDELRKLRARRQTPTGPLEDDSEPPAVEDPQPTPETRMHGKQIGTALRECLEGLVDARRRAVTLYLAGHSAPESGRIMGANTKRAENLVYRGLANLRDCLANKGVAP